MAIYYGRANLEYIILSSVDTEVFRLVIERVIEMSQCCPETKKRRREVPFVFEVHICDLNKVIT